MKVTCNKCHKLFKDSFRQEHKIIDNKCIAAVFIECPRCKTRFFAFFENGKTLSIKEELGALRSVLSTALQNNNLRLERQTLKQIKTKQNILKSEMEHLKENYKKYFEK